MPTTGSPPRVWGQRRPPAHPGFACSVHPHGCGDNQQFLSDYIDRNGSPPRVWGQRLVAAGGRVVRRFTPTGVGTTRLSQVPLPSLAVHPHGCGDNVISGTFGHTYHGSPPRVWGQRPLPARPGLACSVHPHGCGDNNGARILRAPVAGSPPRVWGQLMDAAPPFFIIRFTPTGVGTTRTGRCCARTRTVHPHGCGDNDVVEAEDDNTFGSPPRVWGQR